MATARATVALVEDYEGFTTLTPTIRMFAKLRYANILEQYDVMDSNKKNKKKKKVLSHTWIRCGQTQAGMCRGGLGRELNPVVDL